MLHSICVPGEENWDHSRLESFPQPPEIFVAIGALHDSQCHEVESKQLDYPPEQSSEETSWRAIARLCFYSAGSREDLVRDWSVWPLGGELACHLIVVSAERRDSGEGPRGGCASGKTRKKNTW